MISREFEFTMALIAFAVLALLAAITIGELASTDGLAGIVIEKSISQAQACGWSNQETTCDTITKYHVRIDPGGGSRFSKNYETDKAIYEGLEIGKTYLFQVKPLKGRIESYEH